MGHTNQTANYNLPQFVGTDKPSWLGDINDAFAAIDTAIAAAATEASTADGKADALTTTVSGHTTQIGTLQNTVTSQGNTLNTVTSLIGNGTPTTTDHTIIGAINELHANQGDLDNLTTTDKSSLVAAINEAVQGGGVSAWTLVDSITSVAASSGGAAETKTATVPSGATEVLLQLVDNGGMVRTVVEGLLTDDKFKTQFIRVVTTSITDLVEATFTNSTSTLGINWISGTVSSGCTARLYAK